jgi:hypothetical protein
MAVCNRQHSVDHQLCHWLLFSLDRLPSNQLTMTQQLIANMVGVRREGITAATGKLQQLGAILPGLGLTDRAGLAPCNGSYQRRCLYQNVAGSLRALGPETADHLSVLRRIAKSNQDAMNGDFTFTVIAVSVIDAPTPSLYYLSAARHRRRSKIAPDQIRPANSKTRTMTAISPSPPLG